MKKMTPKYADGSRLQKRAENKKQNSQKFENAANVAKGRIATNEQLKSQLLNPPKFYDKNIKKLNFAQARFMDKSENQAHKAIKLEGKWMNKVRKSDAPTGGLKSVGKDSYPKMKQTGQPANGQQNATGVTTPGASAASSDNSGKINTRFPGIEGKGTTPVGAPAAESNYITDRIDRLKEKYPGIDWDNMIIRRGRGTRDTYGPDAPGGEVFKRTFFEKIREKNHKLKPLWAMQGAEGKKGEEEPAATAGAGPNADDAAADTAGAFNTDLLHSRMAGGIKKPVLNLGASFKGGFTPGQSSTQQNNQQPQQQPNNAKPVNASGLSPDAMRWNQGMNRLQNRDIGDNSKAQATGGPAGKPTYGGSKKTPGIIKAMGILPGVPVGGAFPAGKNPEGMNAQLNMRNTESEAERQEAMQNKLATLRQGALDEKDYASAAEQDLLAELNRLNSYNLALPLGSSPDRRANTDQTRKVSAELNKRGYRIGFSSKDGYYLRDPDTYMRINLGEK